LHDSTVESCLRSVADGPSSVNSAVGPPITPVHCFCYAYATTTTLFVHPAFVSRVAPGLASSPKQNLLGIIGGIILQSESSSSRPTNSVRAVNETPGIGCSEENRALQLVLF